VLAYINALAAHAESGPFYDRYPIGPDGPHGRGCARRHRRVAKDAVIDPIASTFLAIRSRRVDCTPPRSIRGQGVVAVADSLPCAPHFDKGTSGVGRYSQDRGLMRGSVSSSSRVSDSLDYPSYWLDRTARNLVCSANGCEANPRTSPRRGTGRKVYSLYGASAKLGLDAPNDIARLPASPRTESSSG